MKTAKIFDSDSGQQAVLLPDEYRFSSNEVYVQKVGHTVLLFSKEHAWDIFIDGLNNFTDDFFEFERFETDVQTSHENEVKE